MVLKGTILPDHIPVNKFQLTVLGLPGLIFTEISGIEEELEKVKLPDRTQASGGNTLPIEFTVMQPQHHAVERAAMEAWFAESQDPSPPTYKKDGTLIVTSISGLQVVAYTLIGMFPSKRALPEMSLENEGELAKIEWTLNADQVIPV